MNKDSQRERWDKASRRCCARNVHRPGIKKTASAGARSQPLGPDLGLAGVDTPACIALTRQRNLAPCFQVWSDGEWVGELSALIAKKKGSVHAAVAA